MQFRRSSSPAITTEAGKPLANSSAWLGPLSTAIGLGPRTWRMIWLGRSNVSFSIPLITLRTGMPGGSSGASLSSVDREIGRGNRRDEQFGPFARGCRRQETTRISGPSGMPGRWRSLHRRSSIERAFRRSATRAERPEPPCQSARRLRSPSLRFRARQRVSSISLEARWPDPSPANTQIPGFDQRLSKRHLL